MKTYKTDLLDLRCMDCMELMRDLPDNSVDSIVTDPPYGLSKEPDMAEVLRHWLAGDDYKHKGSGFMGKSWDSFVPGPTIWKEAFRVLKPGGHLLAFAGSRTQDLMGIAIRLAGFENRDCIMWVFGSGFPKSLDVGKAIDRMDAVDEKRAKQLRFTEWMRAACPIGSAKANELMGTEAEAGHYFTGGEQPHIATRPHFEALRQFFVCDVPAWIEELVDVRTEESKNFAEREVVGVQKNAMSGWDMDGGTKFADRNITAPATEAAKQWDGWGTALKPAYEPCLMFRKPLAKGNTVAANVLEHGTGAINVNGARVGTEERTCEYNIGRNMKPQEGWHNHNLQSITKTTTGRFPANLIHDGSDEVAGLFPVTGASSVRRSEDRDALASTFALGRSGVTARGHDDNGGSAARFFYQAKCSKKDRNQGLDNTRTVKHITGLCKKENMELVQLLQRATSEDGLNVKWSIGECGVSIMALCPSDSLSITLTAISKITTSEIFSSLPHWSTSASTADASCEMESGGNPAESAEKSNRSNPTTTKESQAESARGARLAVSKMLSAISDDANWKPFTNIHSTVKPTDLMRYLCRLVTPPGGVVLDPFMGSGSTGKAAILEGFRFIGSDMSEEYFEIAKSRTLAAVERIKRETAQTRLF